MFHTPILRQTLVDSVFNTPFGLQLQHTIRGVQAHEGEGTLDIRAIIDQLIPASNGLFPQYQQHDLCELFSWVIDYLHTDTAFTFTIKDHVQGPARKIWEELSRIQDRKHSLMLGACQGVQVCMIQCNHCNENLYNVEPFTTLHVDVSDKEDNLCNLLLSGFIAENIPEWKCDKCAHVGGTKDTRIWKMPKVLVVCIKRFDNSLRKNKMGVDVSEHIKFEAGPAFMQPAMEYKYKLMAIGNHFGSYGGGHYTSVVRGDDNAWVHYDDEHVEKIKDIEPVLQKNQNAYVLFYEAF